MAKSGPCGKYYENGLGLCRVCLWSPLLHPDGAEVAASYDRLLLGKQMALLVCWENLKAHGRARGFFDPEPMPDALAWFLRWYHLPLRSSP
jgi:hypothetical protein